MTFVTVPEEQEEGAHCKILLTKIKIKETKDLKKYPVTTKTPKLPKVSTRAGN